MIEKSKGTLARLLGKENIEIREGNYETAAFDTQNRILMLPKWNFEEEGLLDMVLGHEISHALYTPDSLIRDFQNEHPGKFRVLNCIEDIRIERKIQSRYPGLIRQFKSGRKYLFETDLFGLHGRSANELKFIDRINVKAKIGEFVDVDLTEKEQDFYDRCCKAETVEEVLALTEEAIAMIKEEQDQQKPEPQDSPEPQQSPGGGGDEDGESTESFEEPTGDITDDGTEAESSADDQPNDPGEAEAESSADDQPNDPGEAEAESSADDSSAADSSGGAPAEEEYDFTSETQDKLEDFLDQSADRSLKNPAYPKRDEQLLESVITYEKLRKSRGDYGSTNPEFHAKFEEFRRKNENRVNYLVNEFQRKKAAYQYSRSTEARTGQLNMNKLHQYKIDDNIFRSITRLAEAKDHGMIMFLDYSGSMGHCLKDVIEQTLVLCMFCRKVGIPFEVYSFTSHGYGSSSLDGEIITTEGVHIAELVSSRLNKTTLIEAMEILYASSLISYYSHFSEYESLGGTPLDQTILAAAPIIKRFNQKHQIQKTSVIFLTDGESNEIGVYYRNKVIRWHGRDIEYTGQGTANLFQALKEITGCTLICYRLASKLQYIAYKMRLFADNSYAEEQNMTREFRKNKVIGIPNVFGCDIVFVLKQDSLDIDHEDEFGEETYDMSDKSKMKDLEKAFKKIGRSNKESRIFLNKFTEIIA